MQSKFFFKTAAAAKGIRQVLSSAVKSLQSLYHADLVNPSDGLDFDMIICKPPTWIYNIDIE